MRAWDIEDSFPGSRIQISRSSNGNCGKTIRSIGQTAYSLLTKARRFDLILVSGLIPDVVEQMGIRPPRLDEAFSMAEKKTGQCPGYILPFGADALPVV